MVAYTLKYMEMPKNCWNCKCSNFCSHFREHGCLFNGDRPSGCPLVETEERNKGKWEHDKLFGECAYVCTFCHTIWTSSEIQNMHYCPTCVAEMRGDENVSS